MKKVVSFVAAASNSGKTTLIEKVVVILKARGLNVAVVKHTSNDFEIDRRGKDSWRYQQAGADAVILVSPGRMACLKKLVHEPKSEELEQLTLGSDIVLCEGFKKTAENKIEVFRMGVSGNRPLCADDPAFVALISDKPFPVSIPCFDINDAEGVATFLIDRFINE